MGYESYTGLVAREVDTGDADRYLTILTIERGKLECYAKGIRGAKSKLASQAGLLTFGEYHVYRKGERYVLTSAKALESFYNLRADVAKCAYAAHFLEIARDVVLEAQAFPQAVQTLLNALFVLCYRDLPPDFVSRVFELRTLSLAGFAPRLDACTVCGAELPAGEAAGFDVEGDGLVCGAASCLSEAGKVLPLSRGARRALSYVVGCGAGAIFQFETSAAVASEMSAIIPEYMKFHMGKEYKKLGEAERYRAFENEMRKLAK